MYRKNVIGAVAGLVFFLASTAFAAHPLITDDTGVQGAGKYQLELNLEHAHNDDLGVTENETQFSGTLSYGIMDNLDIAMDVPWNRSEANEGGETRRSENGIADVSISAKWRFYENAGFSLALKPGVTLPTGDDTRGLGAGKVTYSVYLIATQEIKPFVLHLNLGYIRNENKNDERLDIWHVSLAAEYAATEALKIVANVGQEENPDKAEDKDPAFILCGLIYSITENFDVDFGIKRALNDAEPDYTLLAGIAFRF